MRFPCFPAASRLLRARSGLACFALFTYHLAPPPTLAQSPLQPGWAIDAAEPAAATAPLVHPAPGASHALAELPTGQAWRSANDGVGQFTRGHADIVAWEKQQLAREGAAATAAQPMQSQSQDHDNHQGARGASSHHGHHGHRQDMRSHGSKP